jgi:hypothetical protein
MLHLRAATKISPESTWKVHREGAKEPKTKLSIDKNITEIIVIVQHTVGPFGPFDPFSPFGPFGPFCPFDPYALGN